MHVWRKAIWLSTQVDSFLSWWSEILHFFLTAHKVSSLSPGKQFNVQQMSLEGNREADFILWAISERNHQQTMMSTLTFVPPTAEHGQRQRDGFGGIPRGTTEIPAYVQVWCRDKYIWHEVGNAGGAAVNRRPRGPIPYCLATVISSLKGSHYWFRDVWKYSSSLLPLRDCKLAFI